MERKWSLKVEGVLLSRVTGRKSMKRCKIKYMSPYIETIRILDGEIKNLSYHQARFEWTRRSELGLESHPDLHTIKSFKGLTQGSVKCRIRYGKEIDDVEFEPYTRRVVNSLKVLSADHISYGFKYSDRTDLDGLYAQRGTGDDILIIKNGCVTDSYLANVVFWNGEGWFTPDTPLLPGTMRASLLDLGKIKTARITLKDIGRYQKIRLINAMNNLEEGAEVPVELVSY
jgi:4-amino-4-deoxychorismate lyase